MVKEKEFVPFGPEWEKEMMKWSKKMLIDKIRELLQGKNSIKDRIINNGDPLI